MTNESPNEIKSPSVTQPIVAWCFGILVGSFEQGIKAPVPNDILRFAARNVEVPVFVTWMKKRNGQEKLPFHQADLVLRGCIGCLDPMPILDIEKYVLRSAFRDARFPPIRQSEVPMLQCKVSFLCDFENCDHPYDWSIEIHGIIISFNDDVGYRYSATFLPGIALENEMDHDSTINKLIRKSGWGGEIDSELICRLRVTRYRCSKAALNYEQFQSLSCGRQ